MARIINNRYVFIHIAKTGGTFFRETINYFGTPNYELYAKHAPFDMTMKNFIPMAFIRHPLTWYLSRWRYAKMTRFKEKMQYIPEAKNHWMAKVWSDDFATFCGKIAAMGMDSNQYEFKHGKAWTYFNSMIPTGDHAGFIYKYEDLVQVTWQFLHFALNMNITPDQVKALKPQLESSHIPYTVPTMSVIDNLLKLEKDLINNYYPTYDHEQVFTKRRTSN